MNQGHRETSLGPPCMLGSKLSLEPRLLGFWFCVFPPPELYTAWCNSPTARDMLRIFWNFSTAKVTIMGFLQMHKFYKHCK